MSANSSSKPRAVQDITPAWVLRGGWEEASLKELTRVVSPTGWRSLIRRGRAIRSILLTESPAFEAPHFLLILQFIQLASCPWMASYPPTATRPPWFVVWTRSLLSEQCVCHFCYLPHLHSDGADRNDICRYEKRQNSTLQCTTAAICSGYKWLC